MVAMDGLVTTNAYNMDSQNIEWGGKVANSVNGGKMN